MKKQSTTSNQSLNWINKKFLFGFFLFSVFCFLFPTHSYSQDTIRKKYVHSPRMAMLFSTCVPGLGQAYNKKYWKIPIVYATIGTTVYFFRSNNKLYNEYKQSYISKSDTTLGIIDTYPLYKIEQVKELQDYYRKYRDLNVILTALFYALNIADAYVDAHLMNFDISDDLSLHVFPSMNFSTTNRKTSAGLTLALTF